MHRISGFAADLAAVHTSRKHPIGALQFDGATQRVFRYVFNDSGVSITEGLGVKRKDTFAGANERAALSGANELSVNMLGVGSDLATIPDQNYGWVVAEGYTTLVSNGTTTADTTQAGAANGQFTDTTETDLKVVARGVTNEAPVGPGGKFTAYVNFI